VGFLEISLERFRAQSDARAIPGEVVSQFVPPGDDLLDDRLLPPDALGDQEERRPSIMTLELSQDRRRGADVRAVIHGQGHQPRPRPDLEQTPGEEMGHAIEEPGAHATI
jgi:hypothetical protein